MAATHALDSFWRRHRCTALRSLLLVAVLHRLDFLAFLAASSPVLLLTAFLLGALLVHSEPNVPLAGASQDEDRHLYKKIRHLTGAVGGSSGSSSDNDQGNNESSVTSTDDHLAKEEEEEVVKAAVAWTADDEDSIQSIGSLELERDARLEKLMSRRTIYRNLIDLDVHIPAVLLAPRTKNPFLDLHHHHSSSYYDEATGVPIPVPGSAPSSLLGQHTNPFDIHIRDTADDAAMLTRHESFTAGAAPLLARPPSRFKPYFVADVPEGQRGRDASSYNSNSPSSPSSSTASDHQTQQQAAVKAEEAPTWGGKGKGMVVAVDVELISDSSDDDMSLQGDDATASLNIARDHSDEEDSFEVESITQQVAAGKQQQPRVTAVVEPVSHRQQDDDPDKKVTSIVYGCNEWVPPTTLALAQESEKREMELTEIREHHVKGAVPVIDSSGTSAGARVGAAGEVVAEVPTPPAAAAAAPAPPTPAVAASAPPSLAAAPTPPAAAAAASAPARAPSGKPSSKSKVASKKAVFGFFRK